MAPVTGSGVPGGGEAVIARRWRGRQTLNHLACERARLSAAGASVIDLTDTNPTHHGLGDSRVPAILAQAAARAGRYDPDPGGPLVAREALAGRFGGSPEDYWVTSSTSEIYAWLFALLGDPGAVVGVPAPGYPLVEPLARYANLATAPYPLHYLHPYGWEYDAARLDDVAARAVALVAVNPGNPTGAFVGAAARPVVLAACARHAVPLIADEVFFPFTLESGQPPPDRLAGESSVLTFALDGVSKLLCAPGLKLAWLRLSGPAHVVGRVRPVLDEIADTFLPVATVLGLALPELLAVADDAVAATRRRLTANLAQLRALLPETARLRRVDGGWMALVDLPWPDATDPALGLLRDHHVAVHPGWFYDVADRTCVALSLLPKTAVFHAGVERLAGALG